MKVLACYSIKGGVGKTAAAVNLAYLAAQESYRVLLCDLDPQGASSFYFRVRPKEQKLALKRLLEKRGRLLANIRESDHTCLDLLPAHAAYRRFDVLLHAMKKSRERLARLLGKLSEDYDLVILDCPPNLTLLAENAFAAADRIIVPVVPTTLSERTLAQLFEFFAEQDLPRRKLLPFFSMVEYRKRLHQETMERLRGEYKRFLRSEIPYCAEVERMGEERQPVPAFAPRSVGTQAFAGLWEESRQRLKLR